jgi:methenyltetrahydromethanopterin cyclohydrolase
MKELGLTANQRGWIAQRTSRLVGSLIHDAWTLGLSVSRGSLGETIIDCGVNVFGSWEAGRRIVEISHGGMSTVHVKLADVDGIILPAISVESWHPALSTHGLQVSLPLDEIDAAIRVSGPILAHFSDPRLDINREPRDKGPKWGVAVIEADHLEAGIANALTLRSGIRARDLVLIIVPTGSIAGVTQIAGRINECVVFTLEESLGIDVSTVLHLLGEAPIAPAATNALPFLVPDDFIHYAGRAVLTIDADPGVDLAALAEQLTFTATPIYGQRFAESLEKAGGVFEAIPGLVDINKIAQISLIDARSGATFSAGSCETERLGRWLRTARGERGKGT